MIKIILDDFKPLSVNHMFEFNRRTGRRYHPSKVVEFIVQMRGRLYPHKKLLRDFMESFVQTKHGIKVVFIFEIPQKKLITKKKTISLTSGDVFNMEKIFTDILFSHMEVLDDAQILDGRLVKRSSLDGNFNCIINLSIVDYAKYSDAN